MECLNNSCQALLIDDSVYYFDKDNNYVDEAGYYKSCHACSYYKNKEGDSNFDLYKPLYEGYIDANGNKTDKAGYIKSCSKISCSVVDGTYYDKDGNEVSEDNYMKSCFGCLTPDNSEDGKYHGKDGKVTTEDDWKLMCQPHKCQVVGGKYFNDKGEIVTKAQYDKACTNPKTGLKETTKMYLYIFMGFGLIVLIIFGSKKFSKIRNV